MNTPVPQAQAMDALANIDDSWCRCTLYYKKRGLIDPDCNHDTAKDVAQLRAFVEQHPDAQAGDEIDDDSSCAQGGPEYQRGFNDAMRIGDRRVAEAKRAPPEPCQVAAPAPAPEPAAHPPRVTALHTSMLDTAQKRLATVDETLAEVDTLLDEPAAPAVSEDVVEVTDEALSKAMDAAETYLFSEENNPRCVACKGIGHVYVDHDPDLCGTCGGEGRRYVGNAVGEMRAALTAAYPALTARIAELAGENSEAAAYAKRLAVVMWKRLYKNDCPQWEPFDGLSLLLSQIDNMLCGAFVKIETAEREAERLREDAERYRFLRIARSKPVTVPCPYRHDSEKGFDIINGEALDAAIDTARKGETNG